jgi:hypothetical protein
VTTYTLSPKSPTKIVASSPKAWTSIRKFAPYTSTLLAVTGSMSETPSADWDLNPDTIMVPARGTTRLQPKIVSGSGTATLGTPQSDSGITLVVTEPNITATQDGSITVTAGGAPGFYHSPFQALTTQALPRPRAVGLLWGVRRRRSRKPGTISKERREAN